MSSRLRLADDLLLPLQVVTEKIGWLGRTGSGKSYGAMKLAELMHEAGAQFVVLDSVGIWYGLRLDADGKSPGLPIPVLGGLRGDIPLESTGGALVADLVADRGVSVVIDVSQFETDAEKARFAAAFADRFFFRKKARPSAVHVFLEECQEFIPQNPQREETRMLHAFNRMMKIGRNYGIGGSMISQRPQEVNKKSLNLAEVLFAFQMTGPQERKTVEGWIADKGIKDEDIAAELPKLAVGHPHVWSPAWLKISRVVKILPKHTADVSSTPKVGQRQAPARDLSPIDLDRLRDDMKATIEKAKAEDPREQRRLVAERDRQIAELKAQLTAAQRAAPAAKERLVEVPVLTDAQIAKLVTHYERMVSEAERHGKAMALLWGSQHEEARALLGALQSLGGRTPVPATVHRLVPRLAAPVSPRPALIHRSAARESGDASLPKVERAILTALVQRHPQRSSRAQAAILSGYSITSSSFANGLSGLRSKQLIVGAGDDLGPTEAGVTAAGEVDAPPTGAALLHWWASKLGKAERMMLFAIRNAGPSGIDHDGLSQEAGYSRTSSSYANALSTLRTLKLIYRGDPIRASEELFG